MGGYSAGERPRAGESQEPPMQSLPIHSLIGTDVAALQGSQGMATSLPAFQSTWPQQQHHDGAPQHAQHSGPVTQSGQSPRMAPGTDCGQGTPPGQHRAGFASQSQPEAAPAAAIAVSPQAHAHNGTFSQPLQPSQATLESWKASLPAEADGNMQSDVRLQQHYRPPKRKLPFSVGLAQGSKRHAPDALPKQPSAAQQAAVASDLVSDMARMSPSKFLSLHPSPLGQQKSQVLSPHVLSDMTHQASPAAKLTSQHRGSVYPSSSAPWSPAVPAGRPA